MPIQPPTTPYSRKNPFPAVPLLNRKLTLEGSEKETRHYEFSLSGSGLQYEVGDSMGIFPQNNPQLVEELLAALHFSGEESVTNKEGETFSLREGLLKHFQITSPSKQFLEAIAQRSATANELQEMMQPDRKSDLERYLGVWRSLTSFWITLPSDLRWRSSLQRCGSCSLGSIPLAPALRLTPNRFISLSLLCAMKATDGSGKESLQPIWPIASCRITGCRCSCMSPKGFGCPKILPLP